MERLARLVIRRRGIVIALWLVLTVFGAYSAARVSNRWLESFSIPGYSAYETNQRTLRTYGSGEQFPLVAVITAPGRDVTKVAGVGAAFKAAAAKNPGGRYSDFFTTHDPMYLSQDRHTAFAEIFPAGNQGFSTTSTEKPTRAVLKRAAPEGTQVYLTGHDPLYAASSGGDSGGPSVLLEAAIGGLGALVILLFVFGTLPAVAMPLLVAIASILNTFTLVWALTYVADVSIVVQFLIALVGLGVAIDYALLMIFRFREELRHGQDSDGAVITTMQHAGRSVIVSGSTVAVGLLSMLVIPLPFIRSIGIGGMLIPAVSVIAAITLLPAMLSLLGSRINSVRVMPKRIVEGTDREAGFWNRWATFVVRRPLPVAIVGLVIVGIVLSFGIQLNPSEAQAKDLPGGGNAVDGRAALVAAGVSAGVYKPFEILVEGKVTPAALAAIEAKVKSAPGVIGAAAPPQWRKPGAAIVEAIPAHDGAAKGVRPVISNLQHDVLPPLADETGLRVTLGGAAPEERDFVHAVYGNFGYVLLFVIVLTYILLARAFRSLILPLKAVVLNLISLGAAYGIIVFIFQQGHGAEAIWNVPATDAIIPWIPLMIFAFLYGLSMDYEVFMLTRMREAYDDGESTPDAIRHGLARTGKLVTSAALVLAMAFFVLSTSPGTDIKQFGIGLAAGILFDATVIRGLLVPSIMCLLGKWNWWMPTSVERMLLIRRPAGSPGSPAHDVA
jgi:putative drug exporter of the RND superfamily